uniref:Uncharacterized protein n=1 Tax=Lepeophtheirus salmonis TaxID=72036 RepID=A0A0K2VKI6_LEPSM
MRKNSIPSKQWLENCYEDSAS